MEADDKSHTAYHEAGHAVAYCLLGGLRVRAYLFRNESTGEDFKTWLGQCESSELPAREKAIGAISGVCSEMILNEDADDLAITEFIDMQIVEPSFSDWQGLAALFNLETFAFDDWNRLMQSKRTAKKLQSIVADAVFLLRANWQFVECVASHLIAHDVATDWDINEMRRKFPNSI